MSVSLDSLIYVFPARTPPIVQVTVEREPVSVAEMMDRSVEDPVI